MNFIIHLLILLPTKENWDVAKESIFRPDDGRIEAQCRPGLISMLG